MSEKELSGKEFLADFLAFKDDWEKDVSNHMSESISNQQTTVHRWNSARLKCQKPQQKQRKLRGP